MWNISTWIYENKNYKVKVSFLICHTLQRFGKTVVKDCKGYSGHTSAAQGLSISTKLRETLQSCHDPMLDCSQPRFWTTLWVMLPNWLHPRTLLALSLSLFVPFSFLQLCHNIQRTGAHNPGCKHTRGPEVVQQQPRPRDAYELACIRGIKLNLHAWK